MFKNIFKKRKRVLEKSHLDSIISYLTKYTRDDLRFYIKDGYRLEKKPQLSDLRDSGGIEQASNVVLLLHRPDYYIEESRSTISDLQVIIVKNRSGGTGAITLGYNLETQEIKEAIK